MNESNRKNDASGSAIRVRGARQNNLKNLDLDIPLNRFTVVTGVSGSGKSSLAFDTLYAEGQRRYVETFSPYARQFMDRMDRPDADAIEGIPPAIAIDRKDPVRTSRSTVGTMTEITDFMKLLFVRTAVLHCSACGKPVLPESPHHVFHWMEALEKGSRMVITFPQDIPGGPEGKIVRHDLMKAGYDRFYHDGEVVSLPDWDGDRHSNSLHMIADRVVFRPKEQKRILDSLEQAFRMGGGTLNVWAEGQPPKAFSRGLNCARCGIAYRAPLTNLFSFNSPIGACETCRGFGRVIDIDMDLIVPDPSLSLAEGAIHPWRPNGGHRTYRGVGFDDLMDFCRETGIPTDVPFRDLKKNHRQLVIEGTPDYYGIRGFFRWLESKSYKMHVRVFLSRYRSYDRCPNCSGTRFKPEALLYRLDGNKTIADIYAMNVDEAGRFFRKAFFNKLDPAAGMILNEIRSRLEYLKDVGLGYLTLDRQSRTLSGGEVQRVALTSALGSTLVDTLYVLDEPSIGLHARDNRRLAGILKRLRDQGNTVVVVEHDPELIAESDLLLDMGPGAGEKGGEVVYFGPTAGSFQSPTGKFLSGAEAIPLPKQRRKPEKGKWISVNGASEHNLKHIDFRIPLGCLVCLTGVSGSGKSTLAEDILYPAVRRSLGDAAGRPGQYKSLSGTETLADVVLVDQQPIGRTPRANALTYTKAMDGVRKLLAETETAKKGKLGPGFFSFNVPGGRCETCKGEGFERIEMQFLSDVFVSCPDCSGRRFGEKALSITYRNKNIVDMLSMTVAEAMDFFSDRPRIASALQPLVDVGLSYIRLGQPINTYSGGEAQRLKLSRFLQDGKSANRLFIFDEPTTGLHFQDIHVLLAALQQLVDRGNTVLVIEHNMDVIKCADWIVDLGPEGGGAGGEIVVQGPPEKVAKSRKSHTGQFLKPRLSPKSSGNAAFALSAGGVAEEISRPVLSLSIQGAREHNLKDIGLSIPRNQLVVFSGVSGSGKSSLAFDILFAEGQRRYLESLAPYVRQYMRVLERPDVDRVAGLSPTVAIEQRISHTGRRSTVATLTEIYHFLRLLFSKLGTRHCLQCGRPMSVVARSELVLRLASRLGKKPAALLAPKVSGRKGFHKDVLARALRDGFRKARIDGKLVALTENMALDRYREHSIDLVVAEEADISAANKQQLKELIGLGLDHGGGSLITADRHGKESIASIHGVCPTCGIGVIDPDPRLFSFNSKLGACPACNGLGVNVRTRGRGKGKTEVLGVCGQCGGSRLRPEALSVTVGGFSIGDLVNRSAGDLARILGTLAFPEDRQPVSGPIIAEIASRLDLLNRLGLSYLTLERSGDTLSGGEAQRVRLAAQLGSNLRGICYILDEPTIGLHPRDTQVLIGALKHLRDKGNSVLVVEHDEETIRQADTVIDLGPGAGKYGGRVVAVGTAEDLAKTTESVTGTVFRPNAENRINSRLRPVNGPAVTVAGARKNNLKDVTVSFPLGALIGVTGVSGSGKSTLVRETLFNGLAGLIGKKERKNRPPEKMTGWNGIRRVLEVDHSPIGRTPRSVPASYVGFWDDIRKRFAATPAARIRGYSPGRFSFNVAGGRCEACKGQGQPKVSMSFLPDVTVHCEECGGARYNDETLAVTYRGKNIAEVLDLTFDEAAEFFSAVPAIRKPVQVVCDIGLGYLRLGQPSPTLSGGEAQRIKLAEQLARSGNGHTLFVLDEPTTGLHHADVRRLIDVLQSLVDAGNTVVAIEHNPEFMCAADLLIDLGPEGGVDGGQIVACKSPPDMVRDPKRSHTAQTLKKYIEGKS